MPHPTPTPPSEEKKNRVIIERILMDSDGHVTGVDLHDEKFGEAIFFNTGSRHYHGKYGYTIPHHSGEECEHEIGRRMEGGFPGHPHVHPSGFQQCLNCGKTLAELLTTARQELAQDIINDLGTNPNPDGSVSPNVMHWVERKQMQLKAKYLPPRNGLAGTE